MKTVVSSKSKPLLSIPPKDIINASKKIARDGLTFNNEITGEHLLLADVKEISCLVEPFFQHVGLACLAGSSDTGKSSLLRELAIRIVSGEETFLGFKIKARHRSVIYVSTEDDQGATSFLLKKQAQDVRPEQLRDLRFIFDTENLLAELDRRLTLKPADLVIIDCFADSFTGNLKETQDIRAFLHPFQLLAAKQQCLILFLHHTAKRTENLEPSKNNLLSGQGLEAKMRVVIELRSDLTDPYLRHLCIVKANYLAAKYKRESFVLRFNEQNFTFNNTNENVPFELLVKSESHNADKVKWEKAIELKSQGSNYAEIADSLGYASKGSVTKLFDRAKEYGWGNQGDVSSGKQGKQSRNSTEK